MKLTEILQPACIRLPLEATTKEGVIYELADVVIDCASIPNGPELKEAIWKRENTRTTGIGHGIAIPHGKAAGIDTLQMAIGKADPPIEFGSIDGKPVTLIFLLASPEDQTGPHIQALAKISPPPDRRRLPRPPRCRRERRRAL